ncbi:PQQ-binding-like beta-propeller repeat protein [Microbacterium sp. H1-D42]|uniref:outer membrane protein assembly factor BamB family protein n=1 Tax=Microbacterium sp. H1-D42 TaxID=2925844 RepID=UPI001F535B97|nr:PQQ-binding-like beta-propeller repeat protein [Microbacterium sp. H1-D42]UNK71387.1 PQQ-like beta-propeller repeat protein [Microbacterium sp. H1-D42]
MNENLTLTRRRVLQLGSIGAVAVVCGVGMTEAASASVSHSAFGPAVESLGAGVVQFGSKSAVQVGDTIYIGSRNIEPTYVAAFHIPTRRIIATAAIPNGRSIQGMDGSADGKWLYFAIESPAGDQDTVYRWDLTDRSLPAEPLGRAADVTIWNMSVAPDGFAYFGGKEAPPTVWQYSPADGQITSIGTPEATATGIRTVLATDETVYIGSGTVLNGSETTSNAVLAAYDRATGEMRQILPPELADDETVRSLALHDDKLVVGTYGGSVPSKLAVISTVDPTSYRVLETAAVTTRAPFVHDGDLYFSAGANDVRIVSLDTLEMTSLEIEGVDFGEVWGMGWLDGRLHVVSAYGFVAHVDVAGRTAELTGLIDAGAPAEPQLAMSVTAGGGYAYVAGTGSLARHSLDDHTVLNLIAAGETKHGEVVDGRLYMGQYAGLGLFGYDPATGRLPAQLAPLPASQNRPVFVGWDDVNKRVIISTQSDIDGGGAVGAYDPATDDMTVHINPIDSRQLIRWVETRDGIAYLGGDNAQSEGPRGEVVAFDLMSGKELWRIDPQLPGGVSSLAFLGDLLYVSVNKGRFCVIDVVKREIVHTADIRELGTNRSSLAVSGGRVHGVSSTTLYRFDPVTFEPTVVVPELNGAFYGGHTKMDVDEKGDIYTMRDRELVRITVPAYPAIETTVATRCAGRNVKISVTVRNTESVPVDVVITTDRGTKTIRDLAPGQSSTRPFNLHRPSSTAGAVVVEATATVAGATLTSRSTTSYESPVCS